MNDKLTETDERRTLRQRFTKSAAKAFGDESRRSRPRRKRNERTNSSKPMWRHGIQGRMGASVVAPGTRPPGSRSQHRGTFKRARSAQRARRNRKKHVRAAVSNGGKRKVELRELLAAPLGPYCGFPKAAVRVQDRGARVMKETENQAERKSGRKNAKAEKKNNRPKPRPSPSATNLQAGQVRA